MKALLQQRGRKRRGRSDVMASRRESAARMLVTPDVAREQQAEETAWAWSRGEKNLARRLGPSPAAGKRVPQSLAEPLPRALRTRLEEGFGADLDAVRVHRDGAAHSAARMEGARAFTSGSHIYFGPGAFDSESDHGQRLIAHEVAHVLQQTGRAAHRGLRAEDIAASGSVQHFDLPDFSELRKMHAKLTTASLSAGEQVEDPDYKSAANEIAGALRGDDATQPDRVEAFAKDKLPKIKEWPGEAESLLYDVLKELGKFDTAVALVERDGFAGGARIRTAWGSAKIQDVLTAHNGAESYAVAFEKDKTIKAYIDEFQRIMGVFIFQPLGSPIPALYRRLEDKTYQTPSDHLQQLQANLNEPKQLSENEWFEGALRIVNALETERANSFTEFKKQADDMLSGGGLATYRKHLYAMNVLQFGTKIAHGVDLPPPKAQTTNQQAGADKVETIECASLEALGAKIEDIGKKALDLFTRAEGIGSYPGHLGSDPLHHPEHTVLLAAMERTAGKFSMADQMLAEAKELFAPGKDKSWPAPGEEYAKRVGKLADDTERYSRLNLEKAQPVVFRQPDKADEAVALIWLTTWLYQFAKALRKGGDDLSADARLAHQIRMAQALENIADGLEWEKVLAQAQEVATAEKQSTSQLALVSEWEADKSRVEQLADDAKDQPMVGYEPLHPRDLVLFFQKIYLREIGDQLGKLLPAKSEDDRKTAESMAVNSPSLVGQAAQKADAATVRPTRYVLNDSAWAPKEGHDDFRALLGCHPKTVALVAKFGIPKPPGCVCLDPNAQTEDKEVCKGTDDTPVEAGDGTFALGPLTYKDPLFIWVVPGIAGLINTLKPIKLLRDLVAKQDPPVESPDTLPTKDWLARLRKCFTGNLTDTEKAAILKAIRDELLQEKKTAFEDLTPLIRRATTIDRRVRSRLVAAMLAHYTSDHIKYYGRANDAIEAITLFMAGVVPFEEREAQQAALILSAGNAIADAFRTEGRYDIVTSFYGPLDAVLKFAAAPDVKSRLAPFFEADEIAEVLATVPALTEVLENFKAQRAKVQRRFGFRALQGSSTLKSLVYGAEVKLNEKMVAYDGTPYSVAEIRQGFTFHPAYGTQTSPGETGGSYSPPQFMDEADEKPISLDPGQVLLVVEVGKGAGKKQFEVKAGDDVSLLVLKELSYAVENRAFVTGLKELEAIMHKYVDIMMDIGELIPGVGQAITATRILQTAAEFYSQGGYEAVKTFFSGEVRGTLDRFLGDLTNLVNPENLWVVLLFGDERLDNLLAYVSPKSEDDSGSDGDPDDSAEESASEGKFGFVRRVVHAFKKIGLAFAKLMRWVNGKIERPMQDLRAFATTRPILSFVINFLADHIFQIFQLAKTVWDAFHEENEKPEDKQQKDVSLADRLTEQQQDLGKRVHNILERLEEAKLPETVINIDPVVAFIVNKLIVFVGKRLGTKGKIITLILQETGAISFFSDRIAHEIVGAGADPNIYWRDTIKPAVEDDFNKARDALVGGINSALEPFHDVLDPKKQLFTPVDAPAPVTIGFTSNSEEFKDTQAGPPPETQPQPAADVPLNFAEEAPAVGPGMPMSAETRKRFEERFGQDFRHVRLHEGREAARMTDAFGAEALTTGSHVFLRPGLNPAAGRGEETMRHELMHVIQQTGLRPLGEGASAAPMTGAPGRGLVYDPILEQAATEAAKQQPNRNTIRAVEPGAAAHMGMQPALDVRISPFTLGRFFRLVSTLPEIKKRQEEMEGAVVVEYEKEVPDVARQAVDKVVGLLTGLEAGVAAKKVKPAGVFSKVVADISKYLADSKQAAKLKHAAQAIAMESVDDFELPGQEGAKEKKFEKVLHISRFAREMEAYVLAGTGIGITLDLKSSGKSETGKDLIDGDDPVKELKIVHIHLPWVADDFPDLWTKAINNTWSGLDDKGVQQYKGVLLPLLQSKGVAPGIWAFFGDEYQFSILIKSDVKSALGLGGPQLPADKLPTWKEYVETDPKVGKVQPSPIGHVGLRLATYGDDASQTSQGRESHHLTQYLLADYFSNQNPGAQPFDKNRSWPGVKFDASRNVIQIEKPDDAGKPIKVDETRGGDRGGKMPAISLAAVTHRRGSLHITPEPDDFDHKAKHTQAFAVHNEFRANMPADLFETRKKFDKFITDTGKDDVASLTYTAVQRTYKTVRKYMADQLEANMAGLEFNYYKGLALGGPNELKSADEGPFKAALQAIPGKAKTHNETIMRDQLGWDPDK